MARSCGSTNDKGEKISINGFWETKEEDQFMSQIK